MYVRLYVCMYCVCAYIEYVYVSSFTFFPSSVFMYVLLQPILNYSVYFTCMYALMNVNMYSTYIHNIHNTTLRNVLSNNFFFCFGRMS